jgi:uncharacterized Zn-finger protein
MAGTLTYRHNPFLASLPETSHEAHFQIHSIHTQSRQFGNPDSRGVQHFDHRAIPQPHRSREVWSRQQAVDFLDIQEMRQRNKTARRFDRRCRVFGGCTLQSRNL